MNFASHNKKPVTNNRVSLVCRKGNTNGGLKDVSHINKNDSNYVPTGDGDCLAKEVSKISLQTRVDNREGVINFQDRKKQRIILNDDEKEVQPKETELIEIDDIDDEIDLVQIPCPVGGERYQKLVDDNANNYEAINNFYNHFYENLSYVINEYSNSSESEQYINETLDTFDSDSGRESQLEIPEYEFEEILVNNESECDLEIEL